ncbi:MAG: hypothetical protein KDC12_08025 [Flavobacteriales bacterium]|nr:hypothetical protein [Flavobacteriales bacterium]
MKTLSENWITEGLIDFEYKKYLFLAFLQEAEKQFQEGKLYPVFSEIIKHKEYLQRLQEGKNAVSSRFPVRIEGLSEDRREWVFARLLENDEAMKEIEQIIEFALPILGEKLVDGAQIFDFVSKHLELDTVGIRPLRDDEGYLFLHDQSAHDVFIYRYRVSMIETSHERYRSLATTFLQRERKSMHKSFESMKLHLIRKFGELPNPSTWVVSSAMNFPLVETFLPVAKRLMMRKMLQTS